LIGKGDGLAFNGDSPLPFNVHGVKDLIFEGPGIRHAGMLNKPVGQGRFSVINMGNDAEVSYMFHLFSTEKALPKGRKALTMLTVKRKLRQLFDEVG